MAEHESRITRRRFLKTSAPGLAAGLTLCEGLASTGSALSAAAYARVPGANDRIRIGAIGTGGRTRGLMQILRALPDNEQVAVCDVYEPNLLQAAEIAGHSAKTYRDHRALLDRKDIDAVVIGSPDHWHKAMLIDALQAGKDVYIEKPISHSLEEGADMVRAVEASNRVVQTGTQQRSWPHYILGKQLVESGKLGQIGFVRAYWYQNYAGRGTPKNLAPDKLDWDRWLGSAPKQPFAPEKFARWRWYWDFGGGALTDLMTHWIDVIQWYMGTPAPVSALATGALNVLQWECPDTVLCALEYPKNFTVAYDGAMMSGIDDGGIEFRGSRGTLKINRARLAFYPEGARGNFEPDGPEPEMMERSKEDGTRPHLLNFLECVRSRKTPTADIRAGHEAARASHLGNLSLRQQRRIKWNVGREAVE